MAGPHDDADFSGYATKADVVCADGLTITGDAFKAQHGLQLPLVYNHGYDDVENVLGHVFLEHRADGMYAYGYFNDSSKGVAAKAAVQHGDLNAMSIFANELTTRAKAVYHGVLREVSLVLAGANPGALIDFVSIKHSLDDDMAYRSDEDAIIFTADTEILEIKHSADTQESTDELSKSVDEIFNSFTPEQLELVSQMIASVSNSDDEGDDSDDNDEGDDENADEGDDSDNSDDTSDGDAGSDDGGSDDTGNSDDGSQGSEPSGNDSSDSTGSDAPAAAQHTAIDNSKGRKNMPNPFDRDATGRPNEDEGKHRLSHSAMQGILKDAARSSTIQDELKGYAIKHGIEAIDILFPEAKAVTDRPEWITRKVEWVNKVLGGTRHTPFSRIKSLAADLTLEDARAKGYVKGSYKKEQFFEVAKRTTTPQTIYKKQKLDRDDIIDITDFDVVAWIKGEMRLMLDEELARAILIGDGREPGDDDKILEQHIRPIATDDELYQTTLYIDLDRAGATAEDIVDSVLLNRRYYRGTGNPTLFTTEQYIALMLNHKDSTGRRIYQNLADLASTLRVSEIIPVDPMLESNSLVAILVNLQDYTVGADRGGEVSLFDDFDIDYNQQKYLIETRCSGALTKVKSAIVFRKAPKGATRVTPVTPDYDPATHKVTVKETTGIVYKNQATGATLQKSSPITLTPGQSLRVVALTSGEAYYIQSVDEDEFNYTYEDGQTEIGYLN